MNDAKHMRRAIRLARRGEGHVEPNPMVGCVITRDGQVVGEGWHRRFGAPHAEVEALRAAGDAARGATVYVTLEPCCHHGKTPPCTGALIEAGVGRVVVAAVDCEQRVSGRGIAALEQAGIGVTVGVERDDAQHLVEPFIKRQLTGLPWVIVKWAATADGAIATAAGHSQWISNDRSRQLVHRLRGRVDAVLTGIGTALADDPRLTARNTRKRRTARRVVIDPQLRLPPDANLVRTIDQAPLTLVTRRDRLTHRDPQVESLEAAGVELIGLDDGPAGMLELKPLMQTLARQHNATNVLVEAGAATVGTLVDQELVDELWAFIAPKLLGEGGHQPPVALPEGRRPTDRIHDARLLRLRSIRRVGEDVLLRYRVMNRP